MKLTGKNGFALLLIVLGALILLSHFGFGLGHFMGFLVPIAMVFLGYIGIRRGSKFFGWLFLILGVVILLGKFIGIIGLIIAIGMIIYGISIIGNKGRSS